MTEQQARREKDLEFTGIYARDKEFVKQRAKEIRETHNCRAVMVDTGRGGYSVWADHRYRDNKRIQELRNLLDKTDERRERIEQRYRDEMEKLVNDAIHWGNELEELLERQQ